jgi:hypothetical protein
MNLIHAQQADFLGKLNREPFGLDHGLHEHALFARDNLTQVTAQWPKRDFFVAQGAPSPGTRFYDTAPVSLHPGQAFDRLGEGSWRILLKRLERNATGFRELLDSLFAELCLLRPDLAREKVVRMESFLFISSASTITPFHFDPEMNFFFQIAGPKTYHLYAPDVLGEDELERYYLRGAIDIGQIDLGRRQGKTEFRFDLQPGRGMHQPSNAPHWVETGTELSVSYSFSVETESTRATGRTRAFNALSRAMRIAPGRPGASPMIDSGKALVMQGLRPLLNAALALRDAAH